MTATVTSLPVAKLTTNLYKTYRGRSTRPAFNATVATVMEGLGLTTADVPTPRQSSLIIQGVYAAMATPADVDWSAVTLTETAAPGRPVAILS